MGEKKEQQLIITLLETISGSEVNILCFYFTFRDFNFSYTVAYWAWRSENLGLRNNYNVKQSSN